MFLNTRLDRIQSLKVTRYWIGYKLFRIHDWIGYKIGKDVKI